MKLLKQSILHLHDTFLPHARNGYHPHALRHRSLHLYAGLLLSFKMATLFSLGVLPENQAQSSAINVPNVIQLTNNSRQSYGFDALTENAALDKAAQAKADDMLKNQYFAHVSPQGETPWDFFKEVGYNYIIAGENLAVNFISSEGVEDAWMNSPEHRANILNKDFKDIGIGISQGDYKGAQAIFVVQMFGTSIDQPIVAKNVFTVPTQKPAAQTELAAPSTTGKLVVLAAPVLNNATFELTNKKEVAISGRAEGATQVYVFDNRSTVAQLPVSDGAFSGVVSLSEGMNEINAMSLTNEKVSPLSNTVKVQFDATAPEISSADITPITQNGVTEYLVQVQAQDTAVKLIANIGGENIMLQPTTNPDTWKGTFTPDSGKTLQGRVSVTAYDLAGNMRMAEIAGVSSSVIGEPNAHVGNEKFINILGKNFGLGVIDDFYLAFIGALLIFLALAIAKHPRIQHISLIAHTSAIIMFATFLWLH